LKAQALTGLAQAERERGNDEAANYAMALYEQVRATAGGMTVQ
jgi:hypothetical protein